MFVESNNKEENTNGDTNGDANGDANGAAGGDSSGNVPEETVSPSSDDTTTPQGM